MPGEARIREGDVLAGLMADIGDQENLRKTEEQVFLDDVGFELSEPRAEFDVPLVGKPLSPKNNDNIVVEDALDLTEGRIVDVLREIEADFCTAGRTAFLDRWLHRALPRRDTGAANIFT